MLMSLLKSNGIRNVEDARMVIDMGGEHIGVSYGKIKRTPGQLIANGAGKSSRRATTSRAHRPERRRRHRRNQREPARSHARRVAPVRRHRGISPAEVAELKSRFPELKIMQAIPVLAGVPLDEQKVMQYVKDYEPVSDFFLIDTKAPAAGDIGATGLTHDRAIDRAIIDGGITPYQLLYPVRKLLLWRDIVSFKMAANSRKILEAAFPPERFTPTARPQKEYDRQW